MSPTFKLYSTKKETYPNTCMEIVDIINQYDNFLRELKNLSSRFGWKDTLKHYIQDLTKNYHGWYRTDSKQVFQYDSRIYIQTLETAMGAKLAPTSTSLP